VASRNFRVKGSAAARIDASLRWTSGGTAADGGFFAVAGITPPLAPASGLFPPFIEKITPPTISANNEAPPINISRICRFSPFSEPADFGSFSHE
jgi:hypothetical protein